MIISTFKSIKHAYVDTRIDLPWNEMVRLFTAHYDSDRKEDVELYNLVEFKLPSDPTVELGRKYQYVAGVRQNTYTEIPNTVRRCKNNVVSLTGIVLDVDDTMNIQETQQLLDGLEYVLYTTFNHTEAKHKFRVVIPFSVPLAASDIECRQQSIIDTFPGVDHASFSVSQSFYFHSGKNDVQAYHNCGTMINPYDFDVAQSDPSPQQIFQHPPNTLMDTDIERIAKKLKELYPTLDYSSWIRVTWGFCNTIGYHEGIQLMRTYYPEKSRGEYERLVGSKPKGKLVTIGTIIKMIKDRGGYIRDYTPSTNQIIENFFRI